MLILCVGITVSAQIHTLPQKVSWAVWSGTKATERSMIGRSSLIGNSLRQSRYIGSQTIRGSGVRPHQFPPLQTGKRKLEVELPGKTPLKNISGTKMSEWRAETFLFESSTPTDVINPPTSSFQVEEENNEILETKTSSDWKEKLRERVKNKIHKINTIQTKGNLYMIYGYILNLNDNGENLTCWAA